MASVSASAPSSAMWLVSRDNIISLCTLWRLLERAMVPWSAILLSSYEQLYINKALREIQNIEAIVIARSLRHLPNCFLLINSLRSFSSLIRLAFTTEVRNSLLVIKLVLKLILQFFVWHLILNWSELLKSLCWSKWSWQKVNSHSWHILKSQMHSFDLHALLSHRWHFTQWMLHTLLEHLKQEQDTEQESQNTLLQMLHPIPSISSLCELEFTHRQLRRALSFLCIALSCSSHWLEALHNFSWLVVELLDKDASSECLGNIFEMLILGLFEKVLEKFKLRSGSSK